MAYADDRRLKPTPVSVGGAILVNAAMVAGVLMIAPNMIGERPDKPTVIITIPPERPIEIKRKAEEPKTAKPATLSLPPRPQDLPPFQPPINDLRIKGEFKPPIFDGLLGGGEAKPDPLPVPVPVEIGARVHPRYAGELQPEYPMGMIRREIEGRASVRVLVGTDGRVKAVEAIAATEPEFFEATRAQALRKWRFLPATRDGVAIESWREMTVRFQMPR